MADHICVTFVYCMEMAAHIPKLLSHSDVPTILVFLYEIFWQNSNRVSHNETSKKKMYYEYVVYWV